MVFFKKFPSEERFKPQLCTGEMLPQKDPRGRKQQPGPKLCFATPFEVHNLHPLLRHPYSPGLDSAKCSRMFAGEEAADGTFQQVLILMSLAPCADPGACTTPPGRNRVINAEENTSGSCHGKVTASGRTLSNLSSSALLSEAHCARKPLDTASPF